MRPVVGIAGLLESVRATKLQAPTYRRLYGTFSSLRVSFPTNNRGPSICLDSGHPIEVCRSQTRRIAIRIDGINYMVGEAFRAQIE